MKKLFISLLLICTVLASAIGMVAIATTPDEPTFDADVVINGLSEEFGIELSYKPILVAANFNDEDNMPRANISGEEVQILRDWLQEISEQNVLTETFLCDYDDWYTIEEFNALASLNSSTMSYRALIPTTLRKDWVMTNPDGAAEIGCIINTSTNRLEGINTYKNVAPSWYNGSDASFPLSGNKYFAPFANTWMIAIDSATGRTAVKATGEVCVLLPSGISFEAGPVDRGTSFP